MNTSSKEQNRSRFDSEFTHALRVLSLAWLSGAVVLISIQALMAPQHLSTAITVTALSGVVAIIALVPGLFTFGKDASADRSTALMASFQFRWYQMSRWKFSRRFARTTILSKSRFTELS